MRATERNVNDEQTYNFLRNFAEDLRELLDLYGIKNIHGWDDGSLVLTMPDGTEHDIISEEKH